MVGVIIMMLREGRTTDDAVQSTIIQIHDNEMQSKGGDVGCCLTMNLVSALPSLLPAWQV